MRAPRRFKNLPQAAQVYIVLFWAVTGAGIAFALLRQPLVQGHWATVAVFAGAIAVGRLVHTPPNQHAYVLSGPMIVAASILLPPHQAAVAIALGLLPGEVETAGAWYTRVFNYSMDLAAGLVVGAIARAGGETLLNVAALPFALAAAVFWTFFNLTAVAFAVHFTYGRSVQSLLTPSAIITNLAVDGSGLAMAALWQVNPVLLVLGAIPLFGGIYALWMPLVEEEMRLDPKTGAHNSRFVVETLQRIIPEHQESGTPLALFMADINGLREVNQRYGHMMGERALQVCADELKAVVKKRGFVARFGGDEFVVVLPGHTAAQATSLAEEVRQRLRITRVRHEHGQDEVTITVTMGVADLMAEDSTPTDLLHRASTALYEAKRSGAGRVVVHSGVSLTPPVPDGVTDAA